MTNDDLPPLPHGKVWVNYRTHGAEGVYTADQLRAVQREAYEAGKRRAALDILHETDSKLMKEPVATLWQHVDTGPVVDREATWWSLVMGAAASIEDASNCLRDTAAKKQAEGAAAHYRNAAKKFYTHPPQTSQVSAAPTLTDEEITDIFQKYGTGRADGFNAAARAIEAAIAAKAKS